MNRKEIAEIRRRFNPDKNAISCIRHQDFSDETFGPELAIRVRELFRQLIPLYDFFDKFTV